METAGKGADCIGDGESGKTPPLLTSPWVGLIPKNHMRRQAGVDPPVSVPSASGTIPAATTAAD